MSAQDATILVVRIHDSARVDAAIVDHSRARLAEILGGVGIRLEWRDCRPPTPDLEDCNSGPRRNEAVVRLVAGPSTVSAHACAATLLPDNAPAHYVTVFVDCVRQAAADLRVREEVVLACTFAHEIGHVLLGPGHGATGLMQARPRPVDWQRAAARGLTFTPKEAQRLLDALRRRSDVFTLTATTRASGLVRTRPVSQ